MNIDHSYIGWVFSEDKLQKIICKVKILLIVTKAGTQDCVSAFTNKIENE